MQMNDNDNSDRVKQLQLKKQKIVELLKNKGPSLPSTISREVNMSLLFTSAILSEMFNEKSVKISYLKIGGSPLYYMEGQEALLENFTKGFNVKEKEIFQILREKQVLDEEFLEPAHRVAIKGLKDFAFPLKISMEGKDKIFWRFHLLNQEDALKRVEEILKKKRKAIKEEKRETREKEREEKRGAKEEKRETKEEKKELKVRVSRKKGKADFYARIYEHLKEHGLDIIAEINEDDRVCVVSANFNFGKANLLVVASPKKKINEGDLSLAYQQGMLRKMPVLFLTDGELTNKAKKHIELLGSYIFVKKLS